MEPLEYEQVRPRRGGVVGRVVEVGRRGGALLVALVGIFWVAAGAMGLMAYLGAGVQATGDAGQVVVSLVMIGLGVTLVDWARRADRWAREDSKEPGGERQVKRAVWYGILEAMMFAGILLPLAGVVWASAGLVTAESVAGFLGWMGLVAVFLVVAVVMKWVGGRAGERRVRAWRGEGKDEG